MSSTVLTGRTQNGEPLPDPPWKRVTPPFRSQEGASIAFWDLLSKHSSVYLTLNALREHNQRIAWSPPYTSNISVALVGDPHSPHGLKRFSRHGGPDLRDLIGVRLTESWRHPTASTIVRDAS